MGKKINSNNKLKRRRPKREPRRNKRIAPREHWKFKNSHVNKKVLARKADKLSGEKNQKKSEKDEEEIKYLETENKLFINKDYYDVKETDKDILNWEKEDLKNENDNIANDIFDKMNSVNKKIINQKVVDAYKLVGEVLRTYTSGKLPKAFNILSSTEDWEDLVNITEPYNWTPQAMYEAVVQFSSGEILMSYTFYEKYLVPAIRNDIKKNKKLNIHYYNCLKRALFKPSAFFKGIILPMSKTLSAKEASIIGSILRKCSIPNNHASAAIVKLLQICQNDKNGISVGALFFMRLLLVKKYAFPTEVKDKLVKFFLGYYDFDKDKLPVLWHQALLCFIQHYKLDLTEVEKSKLKELNNKVGHHIISSEISKELSFSRQNPDNKNKNKEKMQIE
jgi:essential nuclear protein 1